MKFSFTAVVAVMSALALAACSSGTGAPTTSPDGNKPVNIGVAFYSKTNPMYVEMEKGMRDEAAKLGANLEIAYANNAADTQTNQINTFVTKGVDVILASPVDVKALEPAYQQARGAGIPTLSVGNKVSDEFEDAFIGARFVDVAEETMDTVIKGMGGKGNLLLVTGPPQIAFVQAQKEGWGRALAKAPDVKVIDTVVVPDMSTGAAVDVATSAFTKHTSVDGVLSSQDDIALGVIQAAESRGMDLDKVYFGSWNGSPAAIKAVEQGKLDLTVSMRPQNWGRMAVQTAIDWVGGKKPSEHNVITPTLQITKDNVSTLKPEDYA